MYPSSTLLTRNMRIAIMCTLISLFFIISPIVIMYTAGYRYDPDTRTILETGVISIDIEPRDAVATLNNVRIDKQIPIRLTNRAPGRYNLLLTREGYHSFEHIITVESKQTTYLRDITLFRNALPILTETPPNLLTTNTTFYPHPTANQYLVHATTDGIHEIGILRYSNNTPEYTALTRTAADSLITLSWSPYTNQSVLQLRIDDSTVQTYRIDVQNVQVSDPIITDTVPPVYWSEQNSSPLYVKINTTTWSGIAQSGTIQSLAPNSIPSSESEVNWYVQTNQFTYVQPQTSSTLTASHEIDSIIAIRNNTVLAKREGAILRFQKQDAQLTLEESYEEAEMFMQGNTIYIITPLSITRINEQGNTELLTLTSNKISHVSLLGPDRPELVITNSTGIEIFDPRYNMTTVLIQNDTVHNTIVETSRQQTRIYFTATIGRQTGMFSLDM